MAAERGAALLRLLIWQLRHQRNLFLRGLFDAAIDFTDRIEKSRLALESGQAVLDPVLLDRALALQSEILEIMTAESSLLRKEHVKLQLDRQLHSFLAGQKISAEQA